MVCVVSIVYLLTLNSKHIICLSYVFFAESYSGVSVKKKQAMRGCVVIATLISSSVFPLTVRLNIIVFMFLPIRSVPFFHYFSITSNLLFRSLNINKASKQCTRVSSRSFSRQVPGLSNQCTLALANGLAGRFIYH